VILLFNFQL